MKKVIFIGGTSYSGSTMLDMMLANDERGFSLGEINALFRPWRKHHFEEINKVKEDKIWRQLLEKGEKDFYRNFFIHFPEIDFVIDSSKDPFWIYDQTKYLKNLRIKISLKNLLIYKKPLEIANSFNKRRVLNKWERYWVNYHRLYFSLIPDFKTIPYKDLVTDTNSLKNICAYLEIPYFNSKEKFWDKEQYTFFGNNRTRFHTSNLDYQGEEKSKFNEDEYRKIYYENVLEKDIIENVTDKINKNYLIPQVLFTLSQNHIQNNAKEISSTLFFQHYEVLLRKIKYVILRKINFLRYAHIV